MTNRRPIRINLELPELSPEQAEWLWNFLEDLASQIWDAYENELLDLDAARFHQLPEDPNTDQYSDAPETRSAPSHLVNDSDPDPDF